jgi:chromate reductase
MRYVDAMPRTVAVLVGSLRKESFTRKIANAIAELAAPALTFQHVEIGTLPLYNQDLDNDPPVEWKRFRDQVRAADAVLFATPEYNRSVPGSLKNAIDVGSRPYGSSVWSGKPAAVASVSPGPLGAFGANHHLRQSLVFLDMPTLQQPELYLNNVSKALDAQGKLASDDMRALLTKFAAAFTTWIERHKA